MKAKPVYTNGDQKRLWPLMALGAICIVLAGLAAGAPLWFFPSQKSGAAPEYMADFSGFEQGTKVEAQIISWDNEVLKLHTALDETGAGTLDEEQTKAAPKLYDLTIVTPARKAEIKLRQARENGPYQVSGRGFSPFSKVVIDNAGGALETQTDWSGAFEEAGIMPPEKRGPYAAPIKLALYGGMMDDTNASQASPWIVQVQTTTTPYGPSHQPNIVSNYISASQHMATQASATATQAWMAFGLMLDAKEQLEAQRDIQQLRAEATKDYHPSEPLCRVGSFVRSLATAESAMQLSKLAISDAMMSTYSNREGGPSSNGDEDYANTKLEEYKEHNCQTSDSNEQLGLLCEGATNPGFDANSDIDFTRTFDNPLTVEYDGDDARNIIALARNIYWGGAHKNANDYAGEDKTRAYMEMRRYFAMENLAHNSFATIMAMKNRAPENTDAPGWSFMKSLMREFGMEDTDIETLVGERPSYYAQMDILTKRMFQNPRFYTDLYDKPTNVARMSVSLEAIRSMQARDHYQAALRREMLLSGLVEQALTAKSKQMQAELYETKSSGVPQ